MKKVIRITESKLVEIIRNVISENVESSNTPPSSITQKYIKFMDDNRNIHGIGSSIMAIENCVDRNGYKNPSMIPDSFKKIVILSHAFTQQRRLKGSQLDIELNLADDKTNKLISCVNQSGYGF